MPWTNLTPQPKRHLDLFSRFCTAHRRLSLYFTMAAFPREKCPFSWGIWTPMGQPESSTQTASRSVEPFLQAHHYVRPTDHATRSVTIGRIYACSTAMRPNSLIILILMTMFSAVIIAKPLQKCTRFILIECRLSARWPPILKPSQPI